MRTFLWAEKLQKRIALILKKSDRKLFFVMNTGLGGCRGKTEKRRISYRKQNFVSSNETVL